MKIDLLFISTIILITGFSNSKPSANYNNLKKVNADGAKFGICKYELDLKKDEVSNKYEMKLNFNYKKLFKNVSLNFKNIFKQLHR